MQPLVDPGGRRARAAIFLSGGGSNARAILAENARRAASSPLDPVCLVTDKPDDPSCGAGSIGDEYGIPVVGHSLRAFYEAHGCPRVSLRTPEGFRLREAWTDELRGLLAPWRIDFGIFAGFEPLTNITGDFPCLNVHPGDLTYTRDGKRYLVGLHTVPIERAILAGLRELRSSVIIATPYADGDADMDTGPLLALSPAVPVDMQGATVEELAGIARGRPAARPAGGFADRLERIAARNQNRLKEEGDWVVFPQVVFLVAEGRFALDAAGAVHFREEAGGFRMLRRLVLGRGWVEREFAT